jgi:hypothetical protein
MKTAPVDTTVEELYPRTKIRRTRRKNWYLDKNYVRPKKQFRWTLTERALLYMLRVEQNNSIAEIQKYFRKKNKIPVFLGEDDDSDKFSRTRLHNQIRLVRGTFKGLCYKCRSPLTKKDFNRINRKDKEDPSLGLCAHCLKETTEYKKTRREKALSLGLCPVCVKNKVLKGHTVCQSCLSTSHRHRYIEGLCGRCGERPLAANSITLCLICLRKARKASKEYRSKKQLKYKT